MSPVVRSKAIVFLCLGVVVILLLYREPAGRSIPRVRDATRPVLINLEVTSLNLNGVSPGQSVEELRASLAKNVSLVKKSEVHVLHDSESGLVLILHTSQGIVQRVETDYHGTLMKGKIPLLSWLDPSVQLDALPLVSVRAFGEDFLVTDGKAEAQVICDSMVRKIIIQGTKGSHGG